MRTQLRRIICASTLTATLPLAVSAQATADEVIQLDDVEVTAFQRDYSADTTSTGLGFDADPFDTPITAMSIPMDILTDQQVNNVEDALRNVASVSKFKQGNGGEEKFSIRGFDASQSLFKDGARINNAFNATNIATTETANIERYDVLKGPAAILYGQGEPGGVINYVTKKPLFERNYRSAELIAGSYDYYRAELDLTGPLALGSNQALAYRFISSFEDSGSHRDFSYRERWLLAPSLAWRPHENTTLTLQYEYITDTYTQDRGQILDGNAITGYTYSSRLNSEQFFGVPDWNENTNSDFQRLSLLVDHSFSDEASLSLRASSTRVDKILYDSSPFFVDSSIGQTIDADGNMVIGPRLQGGDGDSDSITLHYQHRLEGAPLGDRSVSHQLMFGADYEQINNDGFSGTVVDANGNRVAGIGYNVVSRQYIGIPAGGLFEGARRPGVQTDTEQIGFLAQDLISIGSEWHVLAGLRYTEFDNNDAGVTHDNWSPRTGIVYRPSRQLSYYASWARGFTPTTATGFNPDTGNGLGGPVVDPETSEQFELGIRWATAEDRLTLNAAVFDLRKKDIVVVDPDSATFPPDEQWSANLGETRTRGFDAQLVGQPVPALRLIAGYAYLDNELTEVEFSAAAQQGNRLPGIPEHSGSFWGVYEFQEGAAEGLGLGIGVFAQSDNYVSTANQSEYDGWMQWDAVAYYKTDRWKFQINVKNFTDEEYNLAQAGTTSDSFGAIRVGTSTPLTVTGSLALEF